MTNERREPVSGLGEWPNGFGNWGRWPGFDGTLNLLSPAHVIRAAGLVRTGTVIGCARPLRSLATDGAVPEFRHSMTSVGEFRPGRQAAMDRIEVDLHSLVNTHLDALSHVGHQGRGFNGVAFDEMVGPAGARIAAIDAMPPIVGRGVLVDVARTRGVERLEPGDYVRAEELEAVADRFGPGDIVLVRTGGPDPELSARADGPSDADPLGRWAGLHVDCTGVLAERDVALLGTDSTTDTFPSPTPDAPSVHMVAEVYLGLPLLHSLDLDELARQCAAGDRDDFLVVVAPLKIAGATGSPVAPVCIL